MGRFYCQSCGTEVDAQAESCQKCGKIFRAVRCPKCGFTGEGELFLQGCPSCGYGDAITRENSQRQTPVNEFRRSRNWSSKWMKRLLVPLLLLLGLFIYLYLKALA